jgi:UDP-3-O-acyl-N-acetylglucosamine deacetylase
VISTKLGANPIASTRFVASGSDLVADLAGTAPIPARLDFVVPRQRRTAISLGGATVEMIEHAMAALAGLQIDNCLVEINGPELPGGDGSSLHFIRALLDAGIVDQTAPQPLLAITQDAKVLGERDDSEIAATPIARHTMAITYELDYGQRSPIRPQQLTIEFSPELFVTNLAYARTFVLEAEAAALRQQGYGTKVTEKDLLIFGPHGVIQDTAHPIYRELMGTPATINDDDADL